MGNTRLVITFLLLLAQVHHSLGFLPKLHVMHPLERIGTKSPPPAAKLPWQARVCSKSLTLNMGFFSNISNAFVNQDYKAQDQRVRASHILIKGDDVGQVLGKIKQLMGELNERMQQVEQTNGADIDALQPIFSELAKRESQCPSGAQGGDLGLFGLGKMVKEFDAVIFPKEEGVLPPPVGALLGPVVTDFGCHVILVTEREVNQDQVEEKLARND